MRLKKSMSMLIAISMLVSNVPIVMAKEEAVKIPSRSIYTHKEIIGKDRYETGRKVLEESKRYKNIIVVNGSEEKLVDGLCASGLVEKLNATILPINPKKVDKKSMEYINKAENVYIIGENQAIPYSFEKSINKKVKVVRIGGKDRYETSEKIAKYIGSYDKAYLVNGAIGHPDAMSISSVAAKEKSPIILTKKDSSKAEKKKGVEYTAIGGTSVISNSLVSKYSAKRIGGETRYETNRMVLNEYYPNSSVRYFTNGETLVDALSAASISKNNGITFINRHKNHDLLEYIDTVQVGGFPYDIVFVNNGTGTGGSGGTVVPPSKPDIPEKPNPPEDSENHDPTPPDVKAIVEYDNFDKDKREYPLDIKIIKESIDPDKKDTITYECRYKDDNGKYVIKKLEKDENGYYPIGHRKAGHYEVDVRATDGHGGESAWIHVEFDPNVPPTKPEISVTPTDAKDFEEDKYVYDEYGDKVIKYPILLGIKKPSTDQDNDKITYEYKEVLNDGTEVTVSENMYYSVGTHTVKVVDYDTHGGKAESDTVTFTIPEQNKKPEKIKTDLIFGKIEGNKRNVTIRAYEVTDKDSKNGDKITYIFEEEGKEIKKIEVQAKKEGEEITIPEANYTASYTVGKHRVKVTVIDSRGGKIESNVEFEVKPNVAPTAPEVKIEIGEYIKERNSYSVTITSKSTDLDSTYDDKITHIFKKISPSGNESVEEIVGKNEETVEYTTEYPVGEHTVRVIAKDYDGVESAPTDIHFNLEKPEAILLPGELFNRKIKNLINSADVTKITFEKGKAPDNAEILDKNGLVKAYIEGNVLKISADISSDKAIYANPDSSKMFSNLEKVTEIDLSNLNTSKVTNMNQMFNSCYALKELNISNLDTSKVTDMSKMFFECSSLTKLNFGNNFDTSKVTNMSNMFIYCKSLQGLDLSSFDTSEVTNMDEMFHNCKSLKEVTFGDEFNTSKVKNMGYMFLNCSSLQGLDLSSFDTSNVTNMSSMFNGCGSLQGLNLSSFDTSNVTNMSSMFIYCKSLQGLNLSNFNTSKVENMSSMFNGCGSLQGLNLSSFNTSKVENMSSMFNGCGSLQGLDLSGFDTSNVEDMGCMFFNCSSLQGLDLRSFDTSNVTDMNQMFYGCGSLQGLNLSSFDTSKVENMSSMFGECNGLKELDLSSFNTSKVINMNKMFFACHTLPKLNLRSFDTSNVEDMSSMFSNCRSILEIDLSDKFNTSKVTNMSQMFLGCWKLPELNLSGFNTSKVTDMNQMFNSCDELKILNLGDNFDTTMVTNMEEMFLNCANLTSALTIKSTTLKYHTGMFNGCSTEPGSKFTLKYTPETKTLVETIKESYKNNPNIVIELEVQ